MQTVVPYLNNRLCSFKIGRELPDRGTGLPNSSYLVQTFNKPQMYASVENEKNIS